MRVVRTTEGRTPRGEQGYQQASPIDYSPIADAVGGIAAKINEADDARQRFDLNQRLLGETNKMRAIFEERKRNPEIDPYTFSESTGDVFNERIAEVLAEYENFDPELVREFEGQLRRTESQFFANSLAYEMEAYGTRAVSQTNQLIEEGTVAVANDWENYSDTLDFINTTIADNPDLTEADRIRLTDSVAPTLRITAAQSFTTDRPEDVITQLDPNGRWKAQRTQTRTVEEARADLTEEQVGALMGDAFRNGEMSQSIADALRSRFSETGGAPFEAWLTQNNIRVVSDYDPEIVEPTSDVLKALTGQERLAVLADAYGQLESSRVSTRATMEVRVNNIEAQIASNNGEVSLPWPTEEELVEAYGPEGAVQQSARLTMLQQRASFMQDWDTSSQADIDAELALLEPDQNDPALATKLPIFMEAQAARNELIQARMDDPAAYVLQTIPSVQQSVERSTAREYYEQQRAQQARLGIPESQRTLWPQEYIDSEKDRYDTLPTDGRYQWMLRHLHGATPAEFSNFLNRMEGSEAYEEGLIAQMLYSMPGSTRTMPMVLDGMAKLRDDPSRRPSNERTTQVFRDMFLSGVTQLNSDASRAIQNAAVSIYVSRGGDPELNDTSLYTESLRMALGGRAGNSDTGWVDLTKNGVSNLTILPPGVTGTRFEQWQENLSDAQIQQMAANGLPQFANGDLVTADEIAEEGVFVMLAPGIYTVMFGEEEGAFGSDGRPIQFRISPDVITEVGESATNPAMLRYNPR